MIRKFIVGGAAGVVAALALTSPVAAGNGPECWPGYGHCQPPPCHRKCGSPSPTATATPTPTVTATPTPTATATPTPTATGTPSPTASTTPPASPTPTGTGTPAQTTPPPAATTVPADYTPPASDDELPVTGPAVALITTGGLLLVAFGVGCVLAAQRRREVT